MKTIHVIGAGVEGQEGFSQRALDLINQAELLMGGNRQLDLFPGFDGEKIVIGANIGDIVERLKKSDKNTVVLASGDPLFFGIGRTLLRNLPEKNLEFVPNVSSVQYAFAKICEPWDDSVFVSVHGRKFEEAVGRIIAHDKAAVLTDSSNTPRAIAAEMIRRGRDGFTAFLCENLGAEDEKITEMSLRQLTGVEAADLNVLILIKQFEGAGEKYVPTLGIPDEEFATSKKLITKEEVRVITLAKLKLRHDMILWDIGAGSGSVSVEADHLMSNGRIFAIERRAQYLDFLKKNFHKFNVRRANMVEGEAPECLEDLPDPDRVFIGGSGGHLWEILEAVDARLPADGRVVLNAVTLDTLTAAGEFLENAGYQIEVTVVNIARTRPLTDYKMFEAYNPVYVITGVK